MREGDGEALGTAGDDPVLAKGRLWFAEARRDRARDAAEVEGWTRRRKPSGDAGDHDGGVGDGCAPDGD